MLQAWSQPQDSTNGVPWAQCMEIYFEVHWNW